VKTIPANILTRFNSIKDRKEVYEKGSVLLSSNYCRIDYIDFQFNHLESMKEKLLPIKLNEAANFQFPLFNREFMIKPFSPGITFAFLKFISRYSKDYENKTKITDQCSEVINLKSIIRSNIKLSAQQSYYFAEILPFRFTKSETLTEDTLSYLYSTTISFSFFHRLFEINSRDLHLTLI
jgi:hypothetical protein